MHYNKFTAKVYPNISSTKEDHLILNDEKEPLYIDIRSDSHKNEKSNELHVVDMTNKGNIEDKDEAQIKDKLLNELTVQNQSSNEEIVKSNLSDSEESKIENLEEAEKGDNKINSKQNSIKEINAQVQESDIQKTKKFEKLSKIKTKENGLKELYATDIALILDKNNKNILFPIINDDKKIEFVIILKQIKNALTENPKNKAIFHPNSSNPLENLNKQDLNQKQDEDNDKDEIKKEVINIMNDTQYQINDYVMQKIFQDIDDPELRKERSKYNVHIVANIARLLSEYLSLDELTVLRKKIFEKEHPSMPSFIRKVCLWIRLKTNGAQEYYFKGIIKKWVPYSINLILCGIEVYNIVNDIILLWTIYQFSLRYHNQYTDYIFLYTAKLVCICIPYIIAYTNGNQILIAKKTFYPDTFSKKPWYFRYLIGLYLTFLGPLYFIFLKILVSMMALLKCLILLFPIAIYHLIDQKIDSLIFKIGLEKSEYDGLLQQMAICQLIFQNLPLAILDILLVTGVFITPGILNESSTLAYTTLASTFANIIIQFIQLKIQANYFQEGFFNYTFNIMKAKLKWIPFLQKIKTGELTDMILDYGYIRCPFWIFSSWFGYYMEIRYQFNEVSMITFSEVIYNLQEKRNESLLNFNRDINIPEIMISNSVNGISLPCLGILLRGLSITNTEEEKIIITDFEDIDWDSKVKAYILESGEHGKKMELRTYYGDSILHMLVQSENRSNFKKIWLYTLMDSIIKNSSFINLDIKDDNDITPLQLALTNDKYYCAHVLLKAGCYNFITSEGDNIFHILLSFNSTRWEKYIPFFESLKEHEQLKNAKNKKGQTPLVSLLETDDLSGFQKFNDKHSLDILGINIPLNDLSILIPLQSVLYRYINKNIYVIEYLIEFINKQENTKFTNKELINHLSDIIDDLKNNENQSKIQDDNVEHPNISDNQEITIVDNHISSETHQNLLYSILSFLLESLAMIDLITDIFVVIQLASNGHTSWTSISILTLLAPYYTCYSPLISCFIERDTFTKARGILGWILITPFGILYFILIDLFYIISELLSLLLTIITFGWIKTKNVNNKLDLLFEHALRLDNLDVKGIRQLRTIAQLIFESIPQLILQARILGYDAQLNIDISSIIISLIAAFIHLLLEASIIIIESKACKTTFGYYSSLCLASRLNWVPFIERLTEYYRNSDLNNPIDYENMNYKICCFSHQIKYEFNKSTLQILKQEIVKLPRKKEKEGWLNILLCPIKNANLNQIWDFLLVSHQRAIIKKIDYIEDFEDDNLIGKVDHLKIDCEKWSYNMNDYILNNIIEMISSRKNTITKIDLDLANCNEITTRRLICLSKSISQLTNLEELNLNISEINLSGTEEEIVEFTMNLSDIKSLVKLNLNFAKCGLTIQNMLNISNMIEKFPKISFLSLDLKDWIIMDDGIKYLAEAIKSLETIQILELAFEWGDNINGEGMIILASNISNLTSIKELNFSIECPRNITKEGLNALSDTIGKLNSLTNLDLRFLVVGDLDDQIVNKLADKILSLQRLSKLKLYFENTTITDEGLGYLGEIFKNNYSINFLDFSFLSEKDISDEGVKKLSIGIQEMSNIQSLKIYFKLKKQKDEKEILSLANVLINKPKLCELSLELKADKIKGSEIVGFASKIKECLQLKTLSFSFSNKKRAIPNESLKSLTEAIKCLTALNTLHLKFYKMKEMDREGLKQLYEMLANHESLILLKLELPEEVRIFSWEKLIEDNLCKKKGHFYKRDMD